MKNIRDNFFNKIAFYLVSLLIFFIPYQALLTTWARKVFSLNPLQYNILSLWKEYILLLLILILIIKFIKYKKIDFNFTKNDYLILLFSCLLLVYFILFNSDLSIRLAAVRYNFEFLFIYILIKMFNFNIELVKKAFLIFFISSIPVIIFGLMQISFLPPEFMFNFGYERNLLEYTKTGIIPTYDFISPFLPRFYRVQSTFPGALQFGSYISVLIILMLSYLTKSKEKFKKIFIILIPLAIIALIATYTRSALIGLFFGLSSMLYFVSKDKKKFISIFLICIASILLITLFLFKLPDFQILVLHGHISDGQILGSTTTHFESLISSINLIFKNPIGYGLGVVGPASKFSIYTFMPESWYLQLAIEIGIIGLGIFIAILINILKDLIYKFKNARDEYKYLYLGVISSLFAVVVMNLFLHTFADTATIYPLFIFIGMLISLNQKQLS